MKVVVQVSGGIDSTVMLCLAIKNYGIDNVYPISFDDGSTIWNTKDSIAVMLTAIRYKVNTKLFICKIPQSDILEYPQDKKYPQVGFIPGLKLFMNSASLAYAQKIGAKDVWIGNMSDNIYGDESEAFLKDLQEMYNGVYGSNIELVCPFMGKSKEHILKLGKKLGVSLKDTVSCDNERVPGAYNCGICDWCKKRKERFVEAGIQDETDYLYV